MTVSPESLYRHQAAGADFLADCGCTRILADEMGLGKTRTAAAAVIAAGNLPCVIVCPVSVKYTWADEIAAVCPEARVAVADGRTKPFDASADFVVVNRDILPFRSGDLDSVPLRQLIVDEAHQCGGYGTARLKLLHSLSERARRAGGGVLALTGTPITNDYTDIHRLFCLVRPGVFGNRAAFESRYCPENVFKERIYGGMFRGKPRWLCDKLYKEARAKGLVPKVTDAAVEELRLTTRKWWLRRLRSQVWKDIPHETRMWRVDIDDEGVIAADREAREALRNGCGERDGRFSTMRRLVADAKTTLVSSWIRDFLGQTGEKLVVMVWHVSVSEALEREFRGACVRVGGAGDAKKRAEREFLSDPSKRLCVCNVKASVGMTLTAARTILFAEMPWTWADFQQAKDRVNRIGQEADSLEYVVCIAARTVEEAVWRIVNRKKELTERVV